VRDPAKFISSRARINILGGVQEEEAKWRLRAVTRAMGVRETEKGRESKKTIIKITSIADGGRQTFH
jgi:hypothetical protein